VQREIKEDSSDLCVFIDDAVASDSLALSRSRFLGDLTGTLRHRRCVVILVSHSISAQTAGAQQGVLGTFTRQQASFVILMRCGNADLLEQFFDQYLSMRSEQGDYQKFKSIYNSHTRAELSGNVLKQSHQGVCVSCLTGFWDRNVANFFRDFVPVQKKRKRHGGTTTGEEETA